MSDSIFRKASVDRVNSPEQLNEYIRLMKPSIWVMLGAVVVLLVGIIVWSIFGTIYTKIQVGAVTADGKTQCYIAADEKEKVTAGMKVTVNGKEGSVSKVSTKPVKLGKDVDSAVAYYSGMSTGDFCYVAQVKVPNLSEGAYSAEITVDEIQPISFVIH